MRSRSRLAALLIATGLLAVAAWWFLIPHQPGYQGKSFSRLLKDVDFGGRRGAAARAAIREIGTNSLPALARYLTHHDSSLERRWFAFTRKYGVGVEWFEDDFQWHRRAALALGELG